MINRIVALLITATVATSFPAKAIIQTDTRDSFVFAVKRSPTWVLTATTNVNWDGSTATVASVQCRGESDQFNFEMNSAAAISWLVPDFVVNAGADDDQGQSPLLGDHLWLYIDGERWEYANIPSHPAEFSNVTYPSIEGGITTGDWRGYSAVRMNESQPWINLAMIYDRLIAAKRIEWSFKSRDWTVVDKKETANSLPKNWQNLRYKVDNTGLQDAVSWCARKVVSKDAYIFPAGMNERFPAATGHR